MSRNSNTGIAARRAASAGLMLTSSPAPCACSYCVTGVSVGDQAGTWGSWVVARGCTAAGARSGEKACAVAAVYGGGAVGSWVHVGEMYVGVAAVYVGVAAVYGGGGLVAEVYVYVGGGVGSLVFV